MAGAETAPDEVLTATAIRAAFTSLASGLSEAATLRFYPDGPSETLTLSPINACSVPVSFTYDLNPEGAGEVRFDVAGADEPVYELDYMLELTDTAVAGRVVVVEDWLRRDVVITDKLGQHSSYQVTGLLGALMYGRNWRRKAQTRTFEPYRPLAWQPPSAVARRSRRPTDKPTLLRNDSQTWGWATVGRHGCHDHWGTRR